MLLTQKPNILVSILVSFHIAHNVVSNNFASFEEQKYIFMLLIDSGGVVVETS